MYIVIHTLKINKKGTYTMLFEDIQYRLCGKI